MNHYLQLIDLRRFQELENSNLELLYGRKITQ